MAILIEIPSQMPMAFALSQAVGNPLYVKRGAGYGLRASCASLQRLTVLPQNAQAASHLLHAFRVVMRFMIRPVVSTDGGIIHDSCFVLRDS